MNKIRCLECGQVLESLFRHDFQSCGCANQTFVDGGRDYSRVGAIDLLKVARWQNGTWVIIGNKDSVDVEQYQYTCV